MNILRRDKQGMPRGRARYLRSWATPASREWCDFVGTVQSNGSCFVSKREEVIDMAKKKKKKGYGC